MDRVDAITGLALAVGLLLVVMVEHALRGAGLETLGLLAYPVGYGSLVLVAWYVWIRPLDLRSPAPGDDVWRSDRSTDGDRRGERRGEDAE